MNYLLSFHHDCAIRNSKKYVSEEEKKAKENLFEKKKKSYATDAFRVHRCMCSFFFSLSHSYNSISIAFSSEIS